MHLIKDANDFLILGGFLMNYKEKLNSDDFKKYLDRYCLQKLLKNQSSFLSGDLITVISLTYLGFLDDGDRDNLQYYETTSLGKNESQWNYHQIYISINKGKTAISISDDFIEFLESKKIKILIKDGKLDLDLLNKPKAEFLKDYTIDFMSFLKLIYYMRFYGVVENELIQKIIEDNPNPWWYVKYGTVQRKSGPMEINDYKIFKEILPEADITKNTIWVSPDSSFNLFINLSHNHKKRFLNLYNLGYFEFSDLKYFKNILKLNLSSKDLKKLSNLFCHNRGCDGSYDYSLLYYIFKRLIANNYNMELGIKTWIVAMKKFKPHEHIFSSYIEFVADRLDSVNNSDIAMLYEEKFGTMRNTPLIEKFKLKNYYNNKIKEAVTVSDVKLAGYIFENCLRYDNANSYINQLREHRIRLFSITLNQEICLLKTNFEGTKILEFEGYAKQDPSFKMTIFALFFTINNQLTQFFS